MIAVISDIHGNYPALKAVLKDIDALNCNRIISLGDVAGYYCMINECIEELRSREILNLLGNHDQYIIENMPCPRSNSANTCLDYQRQIIKSENKKWLEGSRTRLLIGDISMVHAGWNNPIDEYLYQVSEEYFSDRKEKMFISGHTHVQTLMKFTQRTFCNPGSVGQPRDGDRRAAYALIENGAIALKRVDYDIDEIASGMKRAGFDEYYYQNLYQGTKIGGGISSVSVIGSIKNRHFS